MKSYYIFLDDIRYPEDVTWVQIPKYEWTIARDFFQFRDIIKIKGIPSFICYDHDLGAQHYRDLKTILETNKIDYSKYKEKTATIVLSIWLRFVKIKAYLTQNTKSTQ